MPKLDEARRDLSSEPGESRRLAAQDHGNYPRAPFNKLLFALFAACSLAAVFYLPYRFSSVPSTSESWIFGYNNRVGEILLLVAVLIGVFWTRGMNLQLPVPGPSRKLPVKVLTLSLVAYLLASATMCLFAGRYGGFAESFYFIDRAWLLEHGKRPYIDLEYCFGLSYLYGPIFIQHLFHISLNAAYHAYWILNGLTSVLLLYAIINRINFPSPARLSIYFLLFIPGLLSVINMGVNYAGTRYLFPIWFVLQIRRMLESTNLQYRVSAALLTVLYPGFMFLFSSETPIALAFAGVALYIISIRQWSRPLLLILTAEVIALGALFLLVFRTHIFDTIKTDGAGSNSFPIALSPPILFFIATVFFAGCFAYRRIRQCFLNDDCFALSVYSLPMLAAALGRCDPGHLLWNGQGLIVASMFYISNFKMAWRRYQLMYVVFMFLLPTLTGLATVAGQLRQVSSLNSARTDLNAQTDLLERTFPDWSGNFLVPFGFRPNGIGTYLSTRIDYGRFDGVQNLNTIPGVKSTVDHIESHSNEAIILPGDYGDLCQINQAGEKLIMSLLFDTIYVRPVVHPVSIRQPICADIQTNYQMVHPPTERSFGYGLWVRKPIPSRLSGEEPVRLLN